MSNDTDIKVRLKQLRAILLRSESISWGELAELQGLAEFIDPGDVELLEAAGVPEFPEEEYVCPKCGATDNLEVSVQVYRRLIQESDGNIQTEDSRYDSSEDWDDNSAACCVACQWTGFVSGIRRPT